MGSRRRSIMPEMLRWLWRGYPKPIAAQLPRGFGKPGWDPRARFFPSSRWTSRGSRWAAITNRPPAPRPIRKATSSLRIPIASVIYKSDADGKVPAFKAKTGGAKALRIGADGRLYASQPAQKRIVSWGPAGDEKVVAQNVVADDLAVTAKGQVYFVDGAHKNGRNCRCRERKTARCFRGNEMLLPAALTLSPDQAMLVVADAQNKFSWSTQIAADGSLINGEPFYRVDMPDISPYSGVSGVTMDAEGEVFFATALGIQLCEANGRAASILSKPEPGTVSGIAFGGKDLNWIYAAEDGKLFRRPSLKKGIAAWAVVKPPKPPL